MGSGRPASPRGRPPLPAPLPAAAVDGSARGAPCCARGARPLPPCAALRVPAAELPREVPGGADRGGAPGDPRPPRRRRHLKRGGEGAGPHLHERRLICMERGGVTRGRKGKSERGAGRGGAAVTQRAPPLTQPRGAPKVPEIAPRPDGIRAAGGDGRGARRAARHEVRGTRHPGSRRGAASARDERDSGKKTQQKPEMRSVCAAKRRQTR